MISPSAIRKYLNRDFDSHVWIKELSEEALDEAIADLTPRPSFSVQLMKHQKAMFLLGVAYPQFFFMADMGCVDAETEYLSPTGWRRMDDYDGGLVAQYWPETGKAEFVKPAAHVVKPCQTMYRFKASRGVDQKVSAEHRVLYADSKGKPQVMQASDVAREQDRLVLGWKGRFYTTFTPPIRKGIALSDAELRVQIAVIADGSFSWSTNRCAISVKKDRKKVRLRELLRAADIAWKEYPGTTAEKLGFVCFVFQAPRHDKEFTEYYWRASAHQLAIVADEVVYWDGSTGYKVTHHDSFYSRSKKSADFVQYAFAASGRTASLRSNVRSNGTDWTVTARKRAMLVTMAGVDKRGKKTNPISVEPTIDGKKYCFSVPSSFLVFRRNGYIFMSGNTGKTLVILELYKYWMQCKRMKKGLVLAPTNEVVDSWEEQIDEYMSYMSYVTLRDSSSATKWREYQKLKHGIVVATYPGLVAMVSELQKSKRKKDAGKRHRKPDIELIEEFCDDIDGLTLDESTKVGNHESLAFRVSRQISKRTEIHYALAGRPFGRKPEPLWAQFFLVDQGETLTPALGTFREIFYVKKKNPFSRSRYAVDYKLNPKREADLTRAIEHRSIRYKAEECIDLPPLVTIRKHVGLPMDAERYYQKLVQRVLRADGQLSELKSVFLRMRQISSGFVGFRDDDTGERAEVEFEVNPKLEMLLQLLSEIPADSKAVVVHEFIWSGRKICDELRKRKKGVAWIWSGTKDSRAEKERFLHDDDCGVLVLNHKKGGYGMDRLQHVANYEFFYESPVSVIDREQVERRVQRKGQTHERVFIYDLLVRGTMDERLLEYHQEGRDLFAAIIDDPAGVVAQSAGSLKLPGKGGKGA